MSVLRVYDPAECDADGVPFGWERCPACKDGFLVGKGSFEGVRGPRCGRCAGLGSLKAAALAAVAEHYPAPGDTVLFDGRAWTVVGTRRKPLTTPVGGLSVESRYDRGWATLRRGDEEREVAIPDLPDQPARCEGCAHPMSDGAYDYTLRDDTDVGMTFENALWLMDHYHGQAGIYRHRVDPYVKLAAGETPDWIGEHWSACDEGCLHGGPFQVYSQDTLIANITASYPGGAADHARQGGAVRAAWRPVDIWLSGWPHDLRPEKLMLLCLRCLAGRLTT